MDTSGGQQPILASRPSQEGISITAEQLFQLARGGFLQMPAQGLATNSETVSPGMPGSSLSYWTPPLVTAVNAQQFAYAQNTGQFGPNLRYPGVAVRQPAIRETCLAQAAAPNQLQRSPQPTKDGQIWEVTQATDQGSRKSSDSDSEDENPFWLENMETIVQNKSDIEIIVRLALPEESRKLSEKDPEQWGWDVYQKLNECSKSPAVANLTGATNLILDCLKSSRKQKSKNSDKKRSKWATSETSNINSRKKELAALAKLTWPDEPDIPEKKFVQNIIEKCRSKSDQNRVDDFVHLAKIVVYSEKKKEPEKTHEEERTNVHSGAQDTKKGGKKWMPDFLRSKANEKDKKGQTTQSSSASNKKGNVIEKPSVEQDRYEDAAQNPQDMAIRLEEPASDTGGIEIRALSPNHKELFLIENLWHGWRPIFMTYDERREFYHIFLKLNGDAEKRLEYKFMVSDEVHGTVYEEFPVHSEIVVNRVIQSSKEPYVTYDVPLFEKGVSEGKWKLEAGRAIWKYLPKLSSIFLPSEKDAKGYFSIKNEIYSWLNYMKNGFRLTHESGKCMYLEAEAVDNAASTWLESIEKAASRETNDLAGKKRIIAALSLVMAMWKLHDVTINKQLLSAIFNALSVHDLNETQQKALLKEIHTGFGGKDKAAADICNAMLYCFDKVNTDDVTEWILSLPLYWLVYNKGRFKNPCDPDANEISKACLPGQVSEGLKPSMSPASQHSLKKMSDKIFALYQVHPWIVGTYQFTLSDSTLVDLIRENEKYQIAKHFHLDLIFLQLLRSSTNRAEDSPLGKIAQISTHLENMIEQAISVKNENLGPSEIKGICTAIKKILCQLSQAAIDMAEFELCEYYDSWILWFLKMARLAEKWYRVLLGENKADDDITPILHVFVFAATSRIKFFEKKLEARKLMMPLLKFVSCLLHSKWLNESMQERWQDLIKMEVMSLLSKVWSKKEKEFLICYIKNLENIELSEDLQTCLEQHAYNCANKLEKKLSEMCGKKGALKECMLSPRFVKILEKLFLNKSNEVMLSENQSGMESLKLVTQWPFAADFIKLFHGIDGKLVGEEGATRIRELTDNFETAVDSFLKGDMKIKSVRFMVDSKPSVLALHDATKTNAGSSVDLGTTASLKECINQRKVQIEALHITNQYISEYITLCKRLKQYEIDTDYQEISEACHSPDYILRNVIDCSDIPSVPEDGIQSYKGLEHSVIEEMHKISSLQGSKIFQKLWNDIAREKCDPNLKKNGPVTWKDVLNSLWADVKTELTDIFDEISRGKMSVERVFSCFAFSCKNDSQSTSGQSPSVKKLVMEELNQLSVVCRNSEEKATKSINQRADKIAKLLNAWICKEAVDAIMQLKTILDLKGDFKVVEDFQMCASGNISFEDASVPELPGMKSVNAKFVKILSTFVKQEELIKWLLKNMNNRKEVKTFCDVGMVSAGENPLEVDRISVLLSAVMGFGPLIFDWEQNSGWKAIEENCKSVQKAYATDENLLKNWEDTGINLPRFELIRNLHGSVEGQSLSLAQDINMSGVYEICRPEEEETTLDNSLKLYLPQGDDRKILNLCELHDLHSKLMLIAGEAEQGQQDVNQFVEVLTAVESLSRSFVNLLNAGCMLFNDWCARIMCSKEELVILVEFGDGIPALNNPGEVKEINNLANVLQEAHEKWTNYMKQKRMEHYYLNEYSAHQITYLCQHLAKKGLNDQVCNLLSYDQIDDIEEALKTVMEESECATEGDIYDDKKDGLNESDEELDEIQIKLSLIKDLLKEGIEKKIAKAAVQVTENKETSECMCWVLEHEKDEGLIDELSAEFDRDLSFAYEENKIDNYSELLTSQKGCTLKKVIMAAQKATKELKIEGVIKTICDDYYNKTSKLRLIDFLSVEQFGRFLSLIRQHNPEESVDFHEVQHPLKQGQPNLVICSEPDVLNTVLSLYMNNRDHPLPTKSEVLLCTEQTTADEVERFMSRSMCRCDGKGRRLHCLAFADKLTFNVSVHLEEVFESLSMYSNVNRKYQLVILASVQQNYLVTCFEKYHVELENRLNKASIPTYLAEKLRTEFTFSNLDEDLEITTSVQVVSSKRSGVGKSLFVKRIMGKSERSCNKTTIRFLQKEIDVDHVVQRLCRSDTIKNKSDHIIHLDLSPVVQHGIENFLFNLFILGSIQDRHGRVWHHQKQHLYLVEIKSTSEFNENTRGNILSLLPRIHCLAPKEALNYYLQPEQEKLDVFLMDPEIFRSDCFQRPYQYLKRYSLGEDLDKFEYREASGSEKELIEVFLHYIGIKNPSWAQLRHFAVFLNMQLTNCEKSVYCKLPETPEKSGEKCDVMLKGLKHFAVRFMIKMAQDLATPSLNYTDESQKDVKDDFSSHEIRRRWEDEIHPFIFFNEDGHTLTFMNVSTSQDGNLLDENGDAIEKSKILALDLKRQGVPLNCKFDKLERMEQLKILCQYMNIQEPFDPDVTYELTTDNVLKMLAVHMRLRCEIPVIIMGETGCGKTRMIEFMSKLKAGENEDVKNMITLKVHGGIQVSHIYDSVMRAYDIASSNAAGQKLGTILFFDEANTTEAIYAIKEVVCDLTIDGDSFENSQLQVIAACNPYKQLKTEAIEKLQASGLGYRIKEGEVKDLFGKVPMRNLVYRVVPLPPSVQPFVWDFGHLDDEAERIYIQQMIMKLQKKLKLRRNDVLLIHTLLCTAQAHVREKCQNEGRYVSLRDVERSILMFEWFHTNLKKILPRLKEILREKGVDSEISYVMRAMLQTLSVCYHASLENRKEFRLKISKVLVRHGFVQKLGEKRINEEFIACQSVFLDGLKVAENIACNEALRENVFLMTICMELRIPLFLVGKPGSSKSLAKTIVSDNMQGTMSHSELYKNFKQVHILSYQCSALTDATGIESVFKQCSQLQAKQNLKSYVAVVVLDEIGLAEDSPNMPLKILHPLLECGSTMNGTLTNVDPKNKVGFVGISNWALDPAKMNRGIYVMRSKQSKDDLKKTAEGIFEKQTNNLNAHHHVLDALTDSYLKVCHHQEDQGRKEYFGLRDYYSLIKMFHAKCKLASPSQSDVQTAILRNFSGGEEDQGKWFKNAIAAVDSTESNIPISLQEMILENLKDDSSRFLLLLTNQHTSVVLLQHVITNFSDKVQVIFGSSFRNDHNYAERCRNINRIKVCMESGKTVVLLNMTDIHESLYDALNQQYVTLSEQRYVDLGLGGHRVKCRIAEGFRLIVIEHRDIVYSQYPIPLLNRLEKHHLTFQSLLTKVQSEVANKLGDWCERFSTVPEIQCVPADCFLGFHEDTIGSLAITGTRGNIPGDLESCKNRLLQSATIDAVFRQSKSCIGGEAAELQATYLSNQEHDNLEHLLKAKIKVARPSSRILLEITSFSNILSGEDRKNMVGYLGLDINSVMLLSLQQFQTEQEYQNKINHFCEEALDTKSSRICILLIQCPQAHKHGQLIACARYGMMNILNKKLAGKHHKPIIVGFLLSTERTFTHEKEFKQNLLLPFTPDSEIIYVDELKPTMKTVRMTKNLAKQGLSDFLETNINVTCDEDQDISFPSLLQDCICEAVAKVKKRDETDPRFLSRIKILNRLFTDEDELSKRTVKAFVKKMIDILRQREKEAIESHNWIVEEACSIERLQEGGSFGKTLWLTLKKELSVLLAYIISKADEKDNLDIIASSDEHSLHLYNMWLELFDGCDMNWESMRGLKEFYLPSHSKVKDPKVVKIPFSSLINQALTDQWLIVKSAPHGKRKRFFTQFKNSKKKIVAAIGNVLKIQESERIMEAYAYDVINCSFSTEHTTSADIEKMVKMLLYVAMEKIKRLKEKDEMTEEDSFTAIFYCFQKYYNSFQVIWKILKISHSFKESIDQWMKEKKIKGTEHKFMADVEKWVKHQKTSKQFIIHESALHDVLVFVSKEASTIEDSESCEHWLHLARRMKSIFKHTMDLISGADKRKMLMNMWEPVSMLYLLLLHLLPNSSGGKVFEDYIKAISGRAKIIYKGSFKKGISQINTQAFLRTLSKVLNMYHDEVKQKSMLSWEDKVLKCAICSKVHQDWAVSPCGHLFYGKKCLDRRAALASSFEITCSSCEKRYLYEEVQQMELTRDQKTEVRNFKSNCTSFFMECLSQFCFPKQEPNSKHTDLMVDEIQLLVEELVCLSTMSSELEKNGLNLDIATRSNVLLKTEEYDSDTVKKVINEWFENHSDHGDLVTVIIRSFEQSLHQYHYSCESNEDFYTECSHILKQVRPTFQQVCRSPNSSFENFSVVAKLRFVLQQVANCIRLQHLDSLPEEDSVKAVMYSAKRLCREDKSGMLQEYLIKFGCRKYGKDWFQYILGNSANKEFLPPILQTIAEVKVIDYWTLLGQGYTHLRSLLNKTPRSAVEEKLPQWFKKEEVQENSVIEKFGKLLAIVNWTEKHDAELDHFISYFHGNFPEMESLLEDLFHWNRKLGQSLSTYNHFSEQLASTMRQLITMVACICVHDACMMNHFCEILAKPQEACKLFWPAMPQSFYFSLPEEIRNERGLEATYECPNGHIYTIGNCTRPYVLARCPDCNTIIGGQGHQAARGNKRLRMDEHSQAGYKLRSQEKNMMKPTERLSTQGAAFLQFIVHSTMMVAYYYNPNEITNIIGEKSVTKAEEYLLQQIGQNLHQFADSLGRNMDDTVPIIHVILENILKTVDEKIDAHVYDWSSMSSRRNWEREFRNYYLAPVFQNIDDILIDAHRKINEAEDLTSMALYRLIHEIRDDEEASQEVFENKMTSLSCGKFWRNPEVWRIIEHPTVPHLLQCIRDNPNSNTGGVLQIILNTPDLPLLQYLQDVRDLQNKLVSRYQNRLDLAQTDEKSFSEFLTEDTSSQELVRNYIFIWNSVYQKLQSLDEWDEQTDDWFKEITENSPISFALPSTRGRGRCASLLIKHLIDIHNNFLNKCKQVIHHGESIGEIDINQILESHLIRIDKQRDLFPMIHLHTSYHITDDEQGRHHHISYNLDALEKQAQEKFVMSKKLIKSETLPYIKYPQDIGVGADWEKVIENTKQQEPLSPQLMKNVEELLSNCTSADICEGVRTLTHAVSFLAKVESDSSRSLHDYLENDLLLSTTNTNIIPTSAKIQHTLALYQYLSWKKAVNFVRQGLNPYKEALYNKKQEKIEDEGVKERVREAFQHMDVNLFQQHLNEMLIQVPEYNEEWSLVEDIFPDLRFIGNDCTRESWFERIPEEICFKHVSHLFEISVTFHEH